MRLHHRFQTVSRACSITLLLAVTFVPFSQAQQTPEKSSEKPVAPVEPQNPAQFDLLDTKFRFEVNGDSRKEVHALVHINSELGVRQFARLNFDYNRSFQSVEIPLAHITHSTGGTSDILPSAITDNPNPAVMNAPAYQDVRVKSVRILGLGPGDTLEYRVITTTTHHPLAPDFWLDHSFDRTGVVTHEIFEIDLPGSRQLRMHINPKTPESEEKSADDGSVRRIYRWNENELNRSAESDSSGEPDIVLTTYQRWGALGDPLGKLLEPSKEDIKSVATKAQEITHAVRSEEKKLRALYNFVAQKITTVDLAISSTGFRTRHPMEILATGYATTEDKFALFSALASAARMEANAAFFGVASKISDQLPMPSLLTTCAILVHVWPPENFAAGLHERCDHCGENYWIFPSMEVAPFSVLPSTLRGKQAFVPRYMFAMSPFRSAPTDLPFPSAQLVKIVATLKTDGSLTAKVHYSLRGDNELLLRVGFHQTPKEKWKDIAQLLSLTDGFRGKVTSVNASDPYATREPFTVDYEIEQAKFVDWSKKPIRIPALLPQLGLPDPPAKPAPGAATSPIELGTPLEVQTSMTLHLPPDTDALAPTGTSVQRDYATFSSQYSIQGLTLTASRHINFLLRQVPADRAPDYNAFLRAVLSDQAQTFTLDRQSSASPPAKP